MNILITGATGFLGQPLAAALVLRLLEDPAARGAFNLTAPEPATNAAFTAALGRALRRPTPFPAPAVALRLLLGERAQMLVASQRALPRHALALGFRFRHAALDGALAGVRNQPW